VRTGKPRRKYEGRVSTELDGWQRSAAFPLYFAGLDHEAQEPVAGDYVLRGKAGSESWTSPITATVSVNGQRLNTFTSGPREVVITSLLHAGRNEIALISNRVAGVVQDNDIEFTVFGPLEWDVQQNGFTGPIALQFNGMHGWRRDPKTGSLTNIAAPASDKVERSIVLIVKEARTAKDG
jgi:hypothetical protein